MADSIIIVFQLRVPSNWTLLVLVVTYGYRTRAISVHVLGDNDTGMSVMTLCVLSK